MKLECINRYGRNSEAIFTTDEYNGKIGDPIECSDGRGTFWSGEVTEIEPVDWRGRKYIRIRAKHEG